MFVHEFRPDVVGFLTASQIEAICWAAKTVDDDERVKDSVNQAEYCLAAANAFIVMMLDAIAEDKIEDREAGAFADVFEQISADLISYMALQLKKHIEDGALGADVKIIANFAQRN